MNKSITQKIIEQHLISGAFVPGNEVGIEIDQTLNHDNAGTLTYLQFESLGIPRVKSEVSVTYLDHNTLQVGCEDADDHQYLQSLSGKYGIYLSRTGNGICHQVHLERFGKPGKTLLGADSHTLTCGALGMIAIGAGGCNVALAMGGSPYYFTCPKVIKINITGKLSPWVSAKDVILKILQMFTAKGNENCIFEYDGDGLMNLSVPERATIANMGDECGVATSVFPSDEMTRLFLRSQQREEDWIEIKADPGADYDRIIDIDLSEIDPLTAKPHSPDNVSSVRSIGEIEVNQVCIGTCTNSSYKDLATVANILMGKVAHPGVSLVIAPGSKQVLENLARDGYLSLLVSSGARLADCACGFCLGRGYSPKSDGVSLRTSSRNFLGRSGTKDAYVYLVSPETAAAAVITGRFTDPRDLGMEYPEVHMPERLHIDDRMIIKPGGANDALSIEKYRGPGIGDLPKGGQLHQNILAEVTLKVGDAVTLDHILPGRFQKKYRSNVAKYAEFVFEDLDNTFYKRSKEIRNEGKYNIVVAGVSYGEGSSKEHAAICQMIVGIKAVIAVSFRERHKTSLINFGILPLTFKNENSYNNIDQGDSVEIANVRKVLDDGGKLFVRNLTKQKEFEVNYHLSERQRRILFSGGALNLWLGQRDSQ
ncbi:MAG: aconitate hydratase [Deltaproteobacteria bacterium]|nr:aconitate hydratase [Deltaproteobacteria bacterium]